MTAEDNRAKNKETVRRFLEEDIGNEGWDLVEETFAPRFVLQIPFFNEPLEGTPDDVKNIVEKLRTAISDIRIDVDEDLIAENGFVVARWTGTGRHEEQIEAINRKGEIAEIEPTGAEVEVHGMTSFHFSADNKIDNASTVMVNLQVWESYIWSGFHEKESAKKMRRFCSWWRHCLGL